MISKKYKYNKEAKLIVVRLFLRFLKQKEIYILYKDLLKRQQTSLTQYVYRKYIDDSSISVSWAWGFLYDVKKSCTDEWECATIISAHCEWTKYTDTILKFHS